MNNFNLNEGKREKMKRSKYQRLLFVLIAAGGLAILSGCSSAVCDYRSFRVTRPGMCCCPMMVKQPRTRKSNTSLDAGEKAGTV
jgi:hypothetical protein